jgi:hypothetical protein
MRVMMMHRTNPHWEAGAAPSLELIARVGKLMGAMAEARVLVGAEGLRASSQGVRLQFSGGKRTVTGGPFSASNELPAGFAILRVESIEEAIEWATRFANVMGNVEIDIRPVMEPWDLGFSPKPAGLTTRWFMALHKADAASEGGVAPTPKQMAEMGSLIEELTRAGVLVTTEGLQPSSKGVRFKFAGGKHTVTDGPFAESKELIAGYVILEARSLQDAMEWAPRYGAAVGCPELDLRPLAEKS